MEYLYDLKEKLCKELEEYAQKSNMNAGDLEMVHKLTDTIKNLDKIEMLEDGGYSQAGDWEGRGSYARGSSYANRGKHYVRGHYSRDGRMDGYSRHDAKEAMMEQLGEIMSGANDREREILRRAMSQLEQA